MKSSLLVLSLAVFCCVKCNGPQYHNYRFGDRGRPYGYELNPTRNIFPDHSSRTYSNEHLSPYYVGQHYGKRSQASYGEHHTKTLSRPFPQFVPPLSIPTFSDYSVHTLRHPATTVQSHHSPIRIEGHPRYTLAPVRQYVPHSFPLYSPGIKTPPKMVKMHSTAYSALSSMPYAGHNPMVHHSQSWRENENNFSNGDIEYFNHHDDINSDEDDEDSGNHEEDFDVRRNGEALTDERQGGPVPLNAIDPEYGPHQEHKNDDNEDEKDDGGENIEIRRNDKVVADERRDGITPVNALVAVYDAGQEKKNDEHFSKKVGSSYGNEHKSKKGYKSSQGHSSEHKYDKGESGHHDKEVHIKDYEEEGANKKDNHDEKSKHGSHHEEDHGEKRGEFAEKKKHNKGSKTKGYHNVFHKDEYVKDHTFYDDLDESGHYKKFEEEKQGHKKESAKLKKGDHHDSGHEQVKEGNHGKYSKGHHDKADAGYKKKHGNEAHYKREHDYKKNGGEAKKHLNEYLKGY